MTNNDELERERFEVWTKSVNPDADLTRRGILFYEDATQNFLWLGWYARSKQEN